MEKDPPKSHHSFSLKRLFDLESNQPAKKRRAPISLSKSRNHSNSSSQQSLELDIVRPEPVQETHLNIVKKNECDIKDEPLKLEELAYFKDKKIETKYEHFLWDIKAEPVTNEVTKSLDIQQGSTITDNLQNSNLPPTLKQRLEEYACPICNCNLTDVKSSYFRQKHVEECMLNSSQKEEELEFNDCVFCGKKLTHFNSKQRQVHINACLDAADDLKKQHQESMFAGQHVPFLSTLDLCPVCHEFKPFNKRALKQKIVHIKQCARQNQLTISQLLKKFQWIGWGHTPMPATTPSKESQSLPPPPPPPSSSPPPPPKIPEHQLAAYVHDMCDEEDGDFSRKVIIHSTRVPEINQRQEDKLDEELQMALAVSKSMKQAKRKQGITRLNERDWNAANIWSSEDSRLRAMAKLDEILFPESQLVEAYWQAQREQSKGDHLGPSRIPTHGHFFWDLTNNSQSNWDEPLVFSSLFIQDLYS